MYFSNYSNKSDLVYYLVNCPWSYFKAKDYTSLLSFSRKQLLQLVYEFYFMYFSFPIYHPKCFDEFMNCHEVNISKLFNGR